MLKMNELTEEDDVLLMMEFRQERWDEWVKFCSDRGYKPEVN